jgi:hypothetical protein
VLNITTTWAKFSFQMLSRTTIRTILSFEILNRTTTWVKFFFEMLRMDQVLVRDAEHNHHLEKILIRDTEYYYHMGQVLTRDVEQNYHLGQLLRQNGAIILFLSTLLSSIGAKRPQIFCLHFTASCTPPCYNVWMRAADGLKHTKISKSTTGFELGIECCEVQLRPIDLTLLPLAVHYCLHASHSATHSTVTQPYITHVSVYH